MLIVTTATLHASIQTGAICAVCQLPFLVNHFAYCNAVNRIVNRRCMKRD